MSHASLNKCQNIYFTRFLVDENAALEQNLSFAAWLNMFSSLPSGQSDDSIELVFDAVSLLDWCFLIKYINHLIKAK